MDRNDVDWYGYIPAITTPFDAEGAFDPAGFEEQMAWLRAERMQGVVLAGTTGEWFSLSADERATLFAEGRRNAGDELTVLGGCNALTAAEAIQHAKAAEKAKLDGILVTPPPYIVPTHEEVVAFYREVAAGTDMPICVYNWPRGCIVDLGINTLRELADIDNIVAIKNSTGDFRAFLNGMYELEDRVRYFGMPTSELGVELALAGHSDGLMGSGAPLGADHSDFWRAITDGDGERAIELGQRDRVVMTSWFGADYGALFGNAQAIMKTALRLRGIPAGQVRRPLLDLDAAGVERVRGTLESLGVATVDLG
jgi:4-hydroxy-tetrahydrodipicolinate synthase